MIDLLEETPWWLLLLFIYTIIIGLRATEPKTVSFKQLLLLPIFFFAWGVFTLFEQLNGRYFFLLVWAISLFFGSLLGYLQVRKWHFRSNRQRETLTLPGSWSALILSLAIFILKYSFNFAYATKPGALQDPTIFTADVLLSGTIIGMFFGRFWRFKKAYES